MVAQQNWKFEVQIFAVLKNSWPLKNTGLNYMGLIYLIFQ